jgi:hypothetical protein
MRKRTKGAGHKHGDVKPTAIGELLRVFGYPVTVPAFDPSRGLCYRGVLSLPTKDEEESDGCIPT